MVPSIDCYYHKELLQSILVPNYRYRCFNAGGLGLFADPLNVGERLLELLKDLLLRQVRAFKENLSCSLKVGSHCHHMFGLFIQNPDENIPAVQRIFVKAVHNITSK